MKKLAMTSLVCVFALLIACSAAFAVETQSVSPTETDWVQTLTFAQYQGAAALQAVKIDFVGDISGLMAYENRAATPRTITMMISSAMEIVLGSDTLLSINPVVTKSYDAGAYDGVLDFGGTSGATDENVAASDSGSITLTSDLTPFIGNGTVALDVNAFGESSQSGSGNLTTWFTNLAGAQVSITYIPVPEPSALIALGTGIIGLAGLKLRKRS